MTRHYNKKSKKEDRKRLRNNATNAERILWSHLKRKQMNGLKFRRQYGVDSFILDFYCPEIKLAIELDGPSHFNEDVPYYDNQRQKYIEAFGITFLRFNNMDIYNNITGVLQAIYNKAKELTSPLSPP